MIVNSNRTKWGEVDLRPAAIVRVIAWIALKFAAFTGLIILAACDKSSKISYEKPPETETITSIVHLKSLCGTNSTAITKDLCICGTVTANDHYGEFYKMLVIEDASGGISVAIDRTRLYMDYPIGRSVKIYCNGLYLCDYGGKIELGAQPSEEYGGAGRIADADVMRYLRPDDKEDRPLQAQNYEFNEITMQEVDTYVSFHGVHFADKDNWCETDPQTERPQTTERILKDASGREFIVRTVGTCSYALESLPTGSGSIYGIIDYFNGKYSLRVVSREVDFNSSE